MKAGRRSGAGSDAIHQLLCSMLRGNLPEFRSPRRRYDCPNPGTHVEDEATLAPSFTVAPSFVSAIASLHSGKFSPGRAGIYQLHFDRMPHEPQPALGTIERKSLLYKSGLGFHCINHVQGCSHGCRYPCHAFMIFNRHGRVRNYADWCQPRLVTNALQLLDRELTKKRQLPDCAHLCLSTDPFMFGYPDIQAMSLAIIERLNVAGIACSVLTKGLVPADLADPTRFPVENTHGISLVSLDEGFRRRWEPGAAPYAKRIAALRNLHEVGRRTLVHIEPYPTPNIVQQDLQALLEAVAFVDHIFFSRWNYNRRVSDHPGVTAFYREQAAIVRKFCEVHEIEFEVT